MNPAVVSIHDVMPHTLDRVERMLDHLQCHHVSPVTLLVCGWFDWKPSDVLRLKNWVDSGHELAGHGWTHRVSVPNRTLYHKVHSLLISRNAAEHLSLSRDQIIELIRRSGNWFVKHGITTPSLYVPPAWAMGCIKKSDLAELPFRYYETQQGVYDSEMNQTITLPLIGYEVDTLFRLAMVRASNQLNQIINQASGRPLRIGLHPDDFELLMGTESKRIFRKQFMYLSYDELFGN